MVAGVVTGFESGVAGIGPGLFVVAACFCWGMDNHLTALLDLTTPQIQTFLKGMVAGSVNIIIGLIFGGGELRLEWVPMAFLVGVYSYGFSIVLYVMSAQALGAIRGQILFSTSTFWGVLLSFLVLGEPIGSPTLVAIALLVLGIVLTNFVFHTHSHNHPKLAHIHFHNHNDGHHFHTHSGEDSVRSHSHWHEHEKQEHSHVHYPDIHHRHKHS